MDRNISFNAKCSTNKLSPIYGNESSRSLSALSVLRDEIIVKFNCARTTNRLTMGTEEK